MAKKRTAAEKLRHALEESIKLQAHYAKLLNGYDGGQRRIFKDADEWITRLEEYQQAERDQMTPIRTIKGKAWLIGREIEIYSADAEIDFDCEPVNLVIVQHEPAAGTPEPRKRTGMAKSINGKAIPVTMDEDGYWYDADNYSWPRGCVTEDKPEQPKGVRRFRPKCGFPAGGYYEVRGESYTRFFCDGQPSSEPGGNISQVEIESLLRTGEWEEITDTPAEPVASGPVTEKTKFFWLIETRQSDGSVKWLCPTDSAATYTTDANEAIKFATKDGAGNHLSKVWGLLDKNNTTITEHGFIPPSRSQDGGVAPELQAELNAFRELAKHHNGYDAEARRVMHDLKEPASELEAVTQLIVEGGELYHDELATENAKLREELERLRQNNRDGFNAHRLLEWIDDEDRKEALHAFTAGNERQIAYRIELLLRRIAKLEQRPANGAAVIAAVHEKLCVVQKELDNTVRDSVDLGDIDGV